MSAETQGKMGKTKGRTGKKTGAGKKKGAGTKKGTPSPPVLMLGGGGREQKVVEVSPDSIVIKPGSVVNFDGIKCFVTGVDRTGNFVFARSAEEDALGATDQLLRKDFAEPAGVSPEILVMMEPYLLPNLTQDDLHGF